MSHERIVHIRNKVIVGKEQREDKKGITKEKWPVHMTGS